jgi:predicted RNA-binding Zn ribbon-like protein
MQTSNLQTPDYQFDLDAGIVCLDFANTLGGRSAEHLNSYADLIAFAVQSHLLTRDEAAWLQAEAERDPTLANGVLVRAKRLRDVLRSIFGNLALGQAPADADLSWLNFDLAASLSHARVLPAESGTPRGQDKTGPGGYRWGWAGRNLDAPIWPITRSAADLLTSEQQRRLVRQCGADDCLWLFLDTSKNHTRQWCSMQSCGNREKARRHYQRVRVQRDTSGKSTK